LYKCCAANVNIYGKLYLSALAKLPVNDEAFTRFFIPRGVRSLTPASNHVNPIKATRFYFFCCACFSAHAIEKKEKFARLLSLK
jgi:hypothetical protein